MGRKTAGLLGVLIAVSALLRPVATPSSVSGAALEEKMPTLAALIAPFTCDASTRNKPTSP